MPKLGSRIKNQRERQEEIERKAEDQRKAGNSYLIPELRNTNTCQTLSGLPWGGISMKYIVENGKSKRKALDGVRERTTYMKVSHTWEKEPLLDFPL
jgi:hypothetical protein